MTARSSIALALTALVCGAAAAHHSIGGEFDAKDQVTVEGVVRELHLINPHTYILVDVDRGGGRMQRWVLSLGPANKLIRGSGWTPDTVKPGERVTATGRRARRGNGMYVVSLRKEDGTSLIDELQE